MKLFLAAISCAVSAAAFTKPLLENLHEYSFDSFLKDFGKEYPEGKEFQLRKTLFETRVASFVKHNAEGHSHTLGVNQFADMSDNEMQQMKGYNKAAAFSLKATAGEAKPWKSKGIAIADSLDWRTKGAVSPVKNQGGCGSCWAFGSAENIESRVFLKTGRMPILSEQQLVDCAPNPNNCGGNGGCLGSIPELAYDWVKDHGLASEYDYPYTGNSTSECQTSAKPAAFVTGHVRVPSNNYAAVMEALQEGPLAISVAAQQWSYYTGGVFECTTEGLSTELDHVVQLVGYGTNQYGKKYWTIRNSWGEGWGMKGYINVLRHEAEEWCGVDKKPADGTGCDNGPSTVKVCGSCGILYDAVYPVV